MTFTWRTIRPSELDACLELSPARRGDDLIGREAAFKVWQRLLTDPAFRHAVIVADPPPVPGQHFVSFGASVFVTPEFTDHELADPRPGINSRIIASIHAGRPILLSKDQIGVANAGCGADLVILHGSTRRDILEAGQFLDAMVASGASVIACHAGYRLRRVLQETVCTAEEENADRTGVFRRYSQFPETGRVLYTIGGREDVLKAPGTVSQMVFRYNEPVLRLRESEQELLEAALSGDTDEELALALGLSVTAVKARWRAIFSRIAERAGDAAAPQGSAITSLIAPLLDSAERTTSTARDTGRAGRGGQKRHRLIEYIRQHPEELRPYAWDLRSHA